MSWSEVFICCCLSVLRLLRQGEAGTLRELQRRPGQSGRWVAVHPPAPPSRNVHLLQSLRKMACWGVVTRELKWLSLCPITTDVFPHWGLPASSLFPSPAFASLWYGYLILSSGLLLSDRLVPDEKVHRGTLNTPMMSSRLIRDNFRTI